MNESEYFQNNIKRYSKKDRATKYPMPQIPSQIFQAVNRLEILYVSLLTVDALQATEKSDVYYLKPDLLAAVFISSSDLR